MEFWLVADTNLFFECKILADLPWDDLGCDMIVLLLTKPLLDEIDKHKNGSGRTRERALKVYGIVRELLKSGDAEHEVRSASPRVVMRLDKTRPDVSLTEHLDYSRVDDKLVGIVSALQSQPDDREVKLFTDDTGPAFTAHGLNVPFRMIDHSWRRPPAETTETKKIKELEKDLALYRAQEPKISIEPCEGTNTSKVLEVKRRIATPLAELELDEFIAALSAKHPLREAFVPPPPSTTRAAGEIVRTEYLAPSDEDVAEYRAAYPRWLATCRDILARLHEGRNVEAPSLIVSWPMRNVGTRPAARVRVEFEAKGPFKLRRVEPKDHEGDEEDGIGRDNIKALKHPAIPALPSPPRGPIFGKSVTRTAAPTAPDPSSLSVLDHASYLRPASIRASELAKMTSHLGALPGWLSDFDKTSLLAQRSFATAEGAKLFPSAPSYKHLFDPSAVAWSAAEPPMSVPSLRELRQRDPEDFYYDEWTSQELVRKGALTCSVWRHQTDQEAFEFEVIFDDADGEARGVVECTVHAENLTKPEQARVIVTRANEHTFMRGAAEAMIKACR